MAHSPEALGRHMELQEVRPAPPASEGNGNSSWVTTLVKVGLVVGTILGVIGAIATLSSLAATIVSGIIVISGYLLYKYVSSDSSLPDSLTNLGRGSDQQPRHQVRSDRLRRGRARALSSSDSGSEDFQLHATVGDRSGRRPTAARRLPSHWRGERRRRAAATTFGVDPRAAHGYPRDAGWHYGREGEFGAPSYGEDEGSGVGGGCGCGCGCGCGGDVSPFYDDSPAPVSAVVGSDARGGHSLAAAPPPLGRPQRAPVTSRQRRAHANRQSHRTPAPVSAVERQHHRAAAPVSMVPGGGLTASPAGRPPIPTGASMVPGGGLTASPAGRPPFSGHLLPGHG